MARGVASCPASRNSHGGDAVTRPLEQRTTRGTVEFRAPMPGKKMPGMKGYALKFDRLSQNLGGFVERVLPGAVDKSLADGLDVLTRYNHDDNYLVARTGSGTMALTADTTGLLYDVPELPDTTVGRDLAVLLERGDVSHSSFAFFTMKEDWSTTDQGFPLRSLVAVRLVDVAPVNTPAYMDTSAAVRSLAARLDVDPAEIPNLTERNEIVRRLASPKVFDLGRRDALTDMLVGPEGALDGNATAGEEPATDAPADPPAPVEVAVEHPLNERQCAQRCATEAVVAQFGLFDQSSGPNGAHYMPDNPFAADGLACASCVFYEGARSCEAVAGDIAPDAVCKLWIIPADLLSVRAGDDESEQRETHSAPSLAARRAALLARRITL